MLRRNVTIVALAGPLKNGAFAGKQCGTVRTVAGRSALTIYSVPQFAAVAVAA